MNLIAISVVWLVVFLGGIVAPAATLVILAVTPNALLSTGDAGRFVSAEVSAGGFMAAGVTTVQTTAGSIAVFDTFSAPRGQPLVVQHTLKAGIQLCVARRPDTCVPLAGTWGGDMRAVPHPHYRFAWLVQSIDDALATLWFGVGIFAVVGVTAIAAQCMDAEDEGAKAVD